MSDRYVAQQRKYCKFCNCWYADNKASVDSHEKGAAHLASVEKDLNRIRKNKQDLANAERIFMAEMQRIEALAIRALEEDAKRDPHHRNELERLMQAKSKSNVVPTTK